MYSGASPENVARWACVFRVSAILLMHISI